MDKLPYRDICQGHWSCSETWFWPNTLLKTRMFFPLNCHICTVQFSSALFVFMRLFHLLSFLRVTLWIISVCHPCLSRSLHTSCHIIHPLCQNGFVSGHRSFLESVKVSQLHFPLSPLPTQLSALIYSFTWLTPSFSLHLSLSRWCLSPANWFISIQMTRACVRAGVYVRLFSRCICVSNISSVRVCVQIIVYMCVWLTADFLRHQQASMCCSDAHSVGSFGFQRSLGTHWVAPINWFEKGCGIHRRFVNKYSTVLYIYYTCFGPLVHIVVEYSKQLLEKGSDIQFLATVVWDICIYLVSSLTNNRWVKLLAVMYFTVTSLSETLAT